MGNENKNKLNLYKKIPLENYGGRKFVQVRYDGQIFFHNISTSLAELQDILVEIEDFIKECERKILENRQD